MLEVGKGIEGAERGVDLSRASLTLLDAVDIGCACITHSETQFGELLLLLYGLSMQYKTDI